MSFTTKIHDAALKLDLSPRILTGMNLTDLFALLYQQFSIVPEVEITKAGETSIRAFNFIIKLKKIKGIGHAAEIEEVYKETLDTCSIQEAFEEAFVRAADYIKENNIPLNAH